jgi:hypothetical protein
MIAAAMRAVLERFSGIPEGMIGSGSRPAMRV